MIGELVTFISRGFRVVHTGTVKAVRTVDGEQFVYIASGGHTYVRSVREEGSMWCHGTNPRAVAAMRTAHALRMR